MRRLRQWPYLDNPVLREYEYDTRPKTPQKGNLDIHQKPFTDSRWGNHLNLPGNSKFSGYFLCFLATPPRHSVSNEKSD